MSNLSLSDLSIQPEIAKDAEEIALLHDRVFGPGRFVRTAFVIRQGIEPDPRFSFLIRDEAKLVASVRLTPITIGETLAFLLGPLCVAPEYQNQGHGKALVKHSTSAVADTAGQAVLLVGDAPYYGPLGFKKVRNVKLPGPVDYDRLLIANVDPAAVSGVVKGGHS